jgi:hypothetical protein
MTERKIINNAEAAALLGVTESALRQMRYKHTIPYYRNKTGARVYYVENELIDWMLAVRVPTAAEVEEQARRELL